MSISKFIKVLSDVSIIRRMLLPEHANGELTELDMSRFMDSAES